MGVAGASDGGVEDCFFVFRVNGYDAMMEV